MKPFVNSILLTLLLLYVGAAMAQTKVTLPSVCANCPKTPSNPLGEPAPCDGLKNAKDFSVIGGNYFHGPASARISGFISNEGNVYVGWYVNKLINLSDPETCLTGQTPPTSTTALYSTGMENMFTALPATNVLVGAPGQTFKAIQKRKGMFFILSDQGKIYNWGVGQGGPGPLDAIGGTAAQTLTGNSSCEILQTLREIVHPESKRWVSMYITGEIGYAADEAGKWWCWGYGPRAQMPSTSIPLPATTNLWDILPPSRVYTPVQMDRLPVQPLITQTDDQQTFVAGREALSTLTTSFISYIGRDSLVYTYTYDFTNYDNQNGTTGGLFRRDRFTRVRLSGETTANPIKVKKIQRGFYYSSKKTSVFRGSYMIPVDYVLGTDGNIYRFAENDSLATKLDLGNYKFQDFVVRNPRESFQDDFNSPFSVDWGNHPLDLVPVGGSPLVAAQRGPGVLNLTPKTQYDLLAFGSAQGVNFRISKLWANELGLNSGGYGCTLIKSADNNHTYAISTKFDDANRPIGYWTGDDYVQALAIGLGMQWMYRQGAYNAYGPYKLINCQN